MAINKNIIAKLDRESATKPNEVRLVKKLLTNITDGKQAFRSLKYIMTYK